MKQFKFNTLKMDKDNLIKTMKFETPEKNSNNVENLAVNSYNVKLHEPKMKNILYKELEQINSKNANKTLNDK